MPDMYPEEDLAVFARVYARRHSAAASDLACKQADRLSIQGDREGEIVWRRVAAMISRVNDK